MLDQSIEDCHVTNVGSNRHHKRPFWDILLTPLGQAHLAFGSNYSGSIFFLLRRYLRFEQWDRRNGRA